MLSPSLHEPGDEPYVPLACLPHHRERELQCLLLAVERDELRERHAPRLADGRRPTRQGGVLQVASPLEAFLHAALEELSAPDGAVRAVAGPVERHPDDTLFCGTPVVRQAARDVRLMVLHADSGEPGFLQLAGVLGGEVLGMQVVGDQLGTHVEEPAVVLDSLPEGS